MEWSIVELRRHAMNDQTQFEDRPWNYTDKCSYCGGVKAFIDWLEKESKEWIPSSETQDHKDAIETEIARTEEQKRKMDELELMQESTRKNLGIGDDVGIIFVDDELTEMWDSPCDKAIEELRRLGIK